MDARVGKVHLSSRFLKQGQVFASKKFKEDELECTIFLRVGAVSFQEGQLILSIYKVLKPGHDQPVSNILAEHYLSSFIDNRNWTYERKKQLKNGAYQAKRWSGLEEVLPLAEEIEKDSVSDSRMSLANRDFIFIRCTHDGAWEISLEGQVARLILRPELFAACLLKETGELLLQYQTDLRPFYIVRLSHVNETMQQILRDLNIPEAKMPILE